MVLQIQEHSERKKENKQYPLILENAPLLGNDSAFNGLVYYKNQEKVS